MIKPYKGYENHLASFLAKTEKSEEEVKAAQAQSKELLSYTLPEGMMMEDITIDGPDEGQKMVLRIYRPEGLTEKAPVVMEVHGGGWVGGSLEIDNYRCVELAKRTPCVVIGADYRLADSEVCYPKPLMDCYTALNYIYDHADELGIDHTKIALHGTSAGANLVAGLALYVRDFGGPEISLTVLNCPVLSLEYVHDAAFQQLKEYRMRAQKAEENVDYIYLGGYTEDTPPIYAFPGYCKDLSGLGPHMVVVGEYDTLRDDGMRYVNKLLESEVSCEAILAPRVGHGFCTVKHPLTEWVHEGIAMSLRREFDML